MRLPSFAGLVAGLKLGLHLPCQRNGNLQTKKVSKNGKHYKTPSLAVGEKMPRNDNMLFSVKFLSDR